MATSTFELCANRGKPSGRGHVDEEDGALEKCGPACNAAGCKEGEDLRKGKCIEPPGFIAGVMQERRAW